MELNRRQFGKTPDGQVVEAITLEAASICVTVINLGARLQAVEFPDRFGVSEDVVLGCDNVEDYLADTNYLGASIGRVANRIAGGRFNIDGREYRIPLNELSNALHGGPVGFDKHVWAVSCDETAERASVTFSHVSPDGDQGFPGNLAVEATYSLDDAGQLGISYFASTDKPTLVNLTNHTYWALGSEAAVGDALDQELTLLADTYNPTNANQIPTGEWRSVVGTPFDFRRSAAIGGRIRDGQDPQIRLARGFDHNWVFSRGSSVAPTLKGRLKHPRSGRVLELRSTTPCLQFYSGNNLNGGSVGKNGRLYRQGDGVALEPQGFPDAPHVKTFDPITLYPGQTYRHEIVYRFSVE